MGFANPFPLLRSALEWLRLGGLTEVGSKLCDRGQIPYPPEFQFPVGQLD